MKCYTVTMSTHTHMIDCFAESEEDAKNQAESWWYENVVPYTEVTKVT